MWHMPVRKVRTDMNEREPKRFNETKSWFLKNINKIEKNFIQTNQEKREYTQINKIRSTREDIKTMEIVLWKYKGS